MIIGAATVLASAALAALITLAFTRLFRMKSTKDLT